MPTAALPTETKMGAVIFLNTNNIHSTKRRTQPQKYAFRLIVPTNDDIIFELNNEQSEMLYIDICKCDMFFMEFQRLFVNSLNLTNRKVFLD